MNKKKILSLIMALVMLVGVFSPLTALAAGEVESGEDGSAKAAKQTTDVVIHKIEMNDLTGWPKNPNNSYDGSKIEKITDYFSTDAKELDKVIFHYYKVEDKVTYEKLKANPTKYDTKELMDNAIKATGEEKINATYVGKAETANKEGAKVEGLANGYYWFVEDKDSVSRDGRTFSAAAAVPFGLSLPYANKDGKPFTTGENALHVYPKNTLANEPKVDKDFKNPGANVTTPRSEKEKNKPESHNVGDLIEYQVKTEFQPGTKYKTAFWTDQMTEGLEFQENSVEVKVGDKTLVKGTDYTLTTDVNTFKLSLTEAGLKNVNEQKQATTVTIEYKAKLTNAAKVDVPESNDVVFHYGNNPSKGNTPVPNKPSNGEMEVEKSWLDKTGKVMDAPDKAQIKVTLYDANTGEVVKGTQENPNPTILKADNQWKAKWTGLDNNKKYKVKEEVIAGYDAEYGIDGDGKITIKNHKTDNPAPKNPDEPKVVTYGKKFVKMEENGTNRLKGAKFIIKNKITNDANNGKYLKKIDGAKKSAFDTAQQAYEAAVVAYNKAVADNTDLTTVKTNLESTRKTRDEAWNAYLSSLTEWTDKKGEALVLESGEDGSFEIHGLKEGSYALEEIEKPAGYAAIKGDIDFTVGKGTYTAHADGVNFKPEETDAKDAQRVDNKKITIPETGGMGTVLFTVVGISLMAGAVIAMKKNREEA